MPAFFKPNPFQLLAISLLSLTQVIVRYPTLFFLFCSAFLPIAKATMEFIILADKETGEPIGVEATSNFINQIFNHLDSESSSSSSFGTLGDCNMALVGTQGIIWNNELPLSHCVTHLEKINGTIYYNFTSLPQQILVNCLQNFERTVCQDESTKELGIGLGSGFGGAILIIAIGFCLYCCCGESIKNAVKNLVELLQSLYNRIKQNAQRIIELCQSLRILDLERGEYPQLNSGEKKANYSSALPIEYTY